MGTASFRVKNWLLIIFFYLITLLVPIASYALQEDLSPPELTSLVLSSQSLDTSSADAQLNVFIGYTDDLSGFSFGTIVLESPTGQQQITVNFNSQDIISGSTTDGIVSVDVLFPVHSESGIWQIKLLRLTDSVTNNAWYDQYSLQSLGYDTELLVIGGPDLTGPELLDLAISPTVIDVSNGNGLVEFSMQIKDYPSGLKSGTIILRSPSSIQEHTINFNSLNLISGNTNEGLYKVIVNIPQYSESGDWRIDLMRLTDNSNNNTWLDYNQIISLGFQPILTTISDPQDITGPQLIDLQISPDTLIVLETDDNLTLHINFRDLPAGFEFGSVWLRSPSNIQEKVVYFYPDDIIVGDIYSGVIEVSVSFPTYSELGEWRIELLRLTDRVKNNTWLYQTELAQMPVESTFLVTTNQPPVAVITAPDNVDEGSTFYVSAEGSYDPEQQQLFYAWDLDGDGVFDDASTKDAAVFAPDNGVIEVGLEVTDENNAKSYAYKRITIDNVNPNVNLDVETYDPIIINSEFSLALDIYDPGIYDTHQVEVNWGDGSVTTLTEAPSLSQLKHIYNSPGVYSINVNVTDKDGGQATTTHNYAVVYDPDAGFVTGGGWIVPGGLTSDGDDYLPNIDGQSKANFGFVMKYHNGASTPSGNIEFNYSQGDFRLKSSEADWLVVANKNLAHFFGEATIDGQEGVFKFKVTAEDRKDGDKFTIKVWTAEQDPNYDEPIYKASGILGGGQIKIFSKKN